MNFLNFYTVQEWKIVSTPLAVSLLTKGAIYTFAMEVREPRLWTLNPAQFCFLCILSTWKSCRFDKKMVPVILSIFLLNFFSSERVRNPYYGCALWDYHLLCRRCYIASSCKAFLLNESACVSWNEKIAWRSNYIVWNWKVFLRN